MKTVTVGGVLQSTYTYDGLNQLIRHDDAKANKSYTFTYDNGGNITSKKEYAYTTGTLGTATKTIPYAYDSQWKDLCISYDGKAITYDTIGNPLTYDGNTYTWQKGRQLASIENSDYDIEYRYNSNGQRTKKIVNGVTTEYYYSGDLLVAQYDGTYWLKFIYSADGDLVGYTENGTPYYYIKNLQGDVIKVVNRTGYVMGTYNYDAWGNLISLDYNWEDEGAVARRNPIRYRGYYYDTETELYYLNSRYYSAEMGRFLNADGYASTGQGLTGSNMFAYCGNNPIVYSDNNGKSIIIAVILIVGLVFISGCSADEEPSSPIAPNAEPYDSYSNGDVYIVPSDEKAEEIKNNIKESDVIVIDKRDNINSNGEPNPNMQILQSYKISNPIYQAEIADIMLNYNMENPYSVAWERTKTSIIIEWDCHNIAYYMNLARHRTADTDFDNDDEGKYVVDYVKEYFNGK